MENIISWDVNLNLETTSVPLGWAELEKTFKLANEWMCSRTYNALWCK